MQQSINHWATPFTYKIIHHLSVCNRISDYHMGTCLSPTITFWQLAVKQAVHRSTTPIRICLTIHQLPPINSPSPISCICLKACTSANFDYISGDAVCSMPEYYVDPRNVSLTGLPLSRLRRENRESLIITCDSGRAHCVTIFCAIGELTKDKSVIVEVSVWEVVCSILPHGNDTNHLFSLLTSSAVAAYVYFDCTVVVDKL